MPEHTHCHRERLPELTERLRGESRRVTGPRQAILHLLGESPHPLTSKEIFFRLPDRGCNLATIYRSLHLLESLGIVKRYDFGDGTARFELAAGGHEDHHHHLICRGCSRVVEIEDCFPPELERQIARQHGFKAVTHKLEFFGLCPQCSR